MNRLPTGNNLIQSGRTMIFIMVFWTATLMGSCDQEYHENVVYSELDFNQHIKPILSDKCFACHGPDKNARKAGLRLDTPGGALEHLLESGKYAFVSGSSSKSEAYQRMLSEDPNWQMPPPESHLSLSQQEKDQIRRWIEQGAEYKPHWAFIAPQKPDLPTVEDEGWGRSDIDRFVWEKLREKGLKPQKMADKEIIIRRLSFDLTGLPPTIVEIDAFLNDTTPNAYEKLVDRLLDSPHYGERMAVDWLDLARYADTHGFTVDFYRPAWPWRDWVIQAFNDNMPYDQFVQWQLAGDLIPEPSKAQILATGFNRNHAQNAEGGIVNEEFQVAYVADRAETFATAFLGLTLECARCHDHKYDPISQKDYYSLFSFFNQVNESGQITWSRVDMPSPTMLLPDEEVEAKMHYLKQEILKREDSLERLHDTVQDQKLFEQWKRKVKPSLIEPTDKIAHYSFNQIEINNIPNESVLEKDGRVIDPVSSKPALNKPEPVDGILGKGLLLNGDDALDFPEVGRFTKSDPFSIGLWICVPEELRSGVIFHSNKGGIIYNFKGYQLSVEGDQWDVRLAHTFPYNAIHLISKDSIPRGTWQHIMLTYDGSGRAGGVNLYLNGHELEMFVEQDQLYKDIIFIRENVDTHLKVGARWRSKGFRHGKVDELVVYDRELTAWEVAYWSDDKREERLGVSAEEPWDAMLYDYYITLKPESQRLLDSLRWLRHRYDRLVEDVLEVMVIDERERPRSTYLLERGAYDAKGEEVFPATPASIMSYPDTLPPNRMGLGRWLFDPKNPLTARVVVNRLWQQCFGQGFVRTQEDFGNQGDLPTHPELLDWLALELIESGWDLKYLLKQIVMSAAYRQHSSAPMALLEADPANQWLGRGPGMRLTAEMLRDQALAASGLLVRKLGGPSVKPYQPEGLWKVNSGTYVSDTGANLYRRSLYTFWKRTVPPPTMNTFDAANRTYCQVRRQKTSTPLQALTLMNDPQFQEASRVLGQQILERKLPTRAGLTYAFRSLTSRFPSDAEIEILEELYEKQRVTFQKMPPKSEGWLSVGEYRVDHTLDRASLAAYAVVISTLLNFDGAVYKR